MNRELDISNIDDGAAQRDAIRDFCYANPRRPFETGRVEMRDGRVIHGRPDFAALVGEPLLGQDGSYADDTHALVIDTGTGGPTLFVRIKDVGHIELAVLE